MISFGTPGVSLVGDEIVVNWTSWVVMTLMPSYGSPSISMRLRFDSMMGVMVGPRSSACAFSGTSMTTSNVVLLPIQDGIRPGGLVDRPSARVGHISAHGENVLTRCIVPYGVLQYNLRTCFDVLFGG